MNVYWLATIFLLAQAGQAQRLPAQTAQSQAAAPVQGPIEVQNQAIGFGYVLPSGWEAVGQKPAQPEQQQNEENKAPNNAQVRKGIACVDVPLTAQRGKPASVIVIVALPFNCFGQTMNYDDLTAFGAGAAEGLKPSLELFPPITASYKLAGHKMWIERVRATPKGKTAPEYTVEIACTVLKKGAVCWLAQAADAAGLAAFEHGEVTLEGHPASALVPKNVFVKNP